MKRNNWKVMAAYLLCMACMAGAYSVPSETTVFDPNVHAEYESIRIPSVVSTNNGTLLAFAEGRYDSADMKPTDIVCKTSTNGGTDWGPLIVLQQGNGNCLHNTTPVVDKINNSVYLFYNINGQDTVYKRSFDDGLSWSAPQSVSQLYPGDFVDGSAHCGPGHGIQMLRSPYQGRLVISWRYTRPDNKRIKKLIYSDDGGANWDITPGQVMGGGKYRFIDELCIAELTNGNIYFNIRNHLTEMDSTSDRYRIVCQSSDFLNTNIFLTGDEYNFDYFDLQLPEPTLSEDSEGCHASVLKLASTDQGDERNHIIFSNPANFYARQFMTIRSSFDETETWTRGKLLTARVSDYSDLVEIDENHIGILYGTGLAPYSDKVVFCRIPKNWLTEPEVAAWEFEDYPADSNVKTGDMIRNSICIDGLDGEVTGTMYFYRYNGDMYLNFGSGDYLTIDDSMTNDALDFNADETFWVEAKIRTTSHSSGGAGSSGAIIAKDVGPMEKSWWFRLQDGKAKFLICDGNVECSVTSNITVTDGNWHTISAGRYAGYGKLQIYVDGILSGSVTDLTSGGFENDNNVVIGNSNNGSRQFMGHISSVTVSRKIPVCAVTVSQGDLNGDCVIDVDDLSIMLNNWLYSGTQ